MKLVRTDSGNQSFIQLIKLLDDYLAEKDGAEHSYYDQYNKIDKINHVVVVYEDDRPVACGAIKRFDARSMEVKRMFTLQEFRGKGIGTKVLNELEIWAKELGYDRCLLETGKRQPEAIQLYKKNGYKIIPNYGQYIVMDNSVCFEKGIA
jgi:GNAT superfamily N-acetyltransferase